MFIANEHANGTSKSEMPSGMSADKYRKLVSLLQPWLTHIDDKLEDYNFEIFIIKIYYRKYKHSNFHNPPISYPILNKLLQISVKKSSISIAKKTFNTIGMRAQQ